MCIQERMHKFQQISRFLSEHDYFYFIDYVYAGMIGYHMRQKNFLEKNSDSLTWNGPNMYNMYTKKYFSCFRFVHDILDHISRPATKFPNMYKNPTKPFVHNKKVFLREKGK